jgi:hypothetical protein
MNTELRVVLVLSVLESETVVYDACFRVDGFEGSDDFRWGTILPWPAVTVGMTMSVCWCV